MYAIVEIAGQQFKVEKDQKIFVHRLPEEEGKDVSFDKVLLIDNDSSIALGNPILKDAQVDAQILQHLKGDKVIVFKKKKRKGFKKRNGHRQYLTEIQIKDIVEKATTKTKVAATKEVPVAPAAKEEVKKEVVAKKEATTAKAEVKPTATKKEVVKKATPAKAEVKPTKEDK